MSKIPVAHPQDDHLLRYADGELPPREAADVRAHLEACWPCRAEYEEIQKVISACGRYRKTVLRTHLTPPAPWGDIYRQFEKADAEIRNESMAARFRAFVESTFGSPRRWAVAAMVAVLGWVVVEQFRNAPSVRAAELLRKAEAAESRNPAPRRLEIRTRTKRATRMVGPAATPARVPSAEAETLAAVQDLFEAAHYGWDDPLSARSYSAWREQLSDRRDEVTTVDGLEPAGGSCYQIRTTTASSPLTAATLKLRMNDFRPVEGTFEFRNREWVGVMELAAEPRLAAAAPVVEPAAPAAAAAAPAASAPAPVAPPAATAGDELRVMAELHRLGADLGEPIDVARTEGHIVVSGMGIEPRRRQEMQSALGRLPRVELRFVEPDAAGVAAQAPARPTAARPERSPLQAQIEEHLGGRAALERFTDQTLEASDSLTAHAHAFRRLAERFPPAVESQLSGAERGVLLSLRRAYTEAVVLRATDLERSVSPVLAALGAPPVVFHSAPLGAWQIGAEEVFQAARQSERLLAALLGGAAAEMSPERLPVRLAEQLSQLRGAAENASRATRSESVR
jgi:anti-sigma factor RsiW